MFILCQTATAIEEYDLQHRIIADVYFVSNRNYGVFVNMLKIIIADVYFVSNRNR